MEVCISDIKKIIEENLLKDEKQNLLFIGYDVDFITDEIFKVMDKFNVKHFDDLYPEKFNVLEEDGTIAEYPDTYVLDDTLLENALNEPTVLYYKRFCYCKNGEKEQEKLNELIIEDKFQACNKQHSLKNRLFTVATCFPKECDPDCVSELNSKLENAFTNYEVKISFNDMLENIISKHEFDIDELLSEISIGQDINLNEFKKEEIKERETLKKLLDLNIQIDDCAFEEQEIERGICTLYYRNNSLLEFTKYLRNIVSSFPSGKHKDKLANDVSAIEKAINKISK